jgi:Fic family protein
MISSKIRTARIFTLEDFLIENNIIEGIDEELTEKQIEIAKAFLELEELFVEDIENFVNAFEPGARLRIKEGDNVVVGMHKPPLGGENIKKDLESLVRKINEHKVNCGGFQPLNNGSAYMLHCEYETLHPFTDCNGRSGRIIWLWIMRGIQKAPLGFLHHWYYQSLNYFRTRRQ